MDKLEQYRKLIRQVIEENASYSSSDGVVETEIIADSILDHYELIRVGWEGEHRINGAVLHIDIRNSKIYIQHDGTELSAAKRLVDLGVPKSDIVLAYQSPFKRKFTEYAIE